MDNSVVKIRLLAKAEPPPLQLAEPARLAGLFGAGQLAELGAVFVYCLSSHYTCDFVLESTSKSKFQLK